MKSLRGLEIAAGRTRVSGGNAFGQIGRDAKIESPARSKFVERAFLVEAARMHRPFDDFTFLAAEVQTLVRSADRHGPEINVGRVLAVDADFVFASRAALFERRKIHEGKEDGALDLIGVGAGEKHDGAVRIDALYRILLRLIKAVSRGVREEREYVVLIGNLRAHACSSRKG